MIYTDGGSINNPGPGGYGTVIEMDGDRRELSGGFRLTTNNRMEMTAALVALEAVAECGRPVCLHSDSRYLVNGITRGWAKGWRKRGWKKSDGEPALNADLWARLLVLVEGMEVQFYWVKGHAGNPLNERCDQLAVAAARGNPQAVDAEYEKNVA
nr:ribonuclease HI [Desulforhopalus vacuolatus]